MEEGVRDCNVVYYGGVAVCFAGVWDGGEIVEGEALEEIFEHGVRGFCVPVASKDRKGKGSKEVVEIVKGEGEVFVFVEV